MNKILSLDTSSKITGYAVFNDGKLIRYSSIDRSDIKDSEKRMRDMVECLITLLEREAPDVVVIEEAVVTRNPQTQRMLSMILGVVFGVCVNNHFNYCSLRPTQWRKAVRGDDEKLPRKREELKLWSINKVAELYDIQDICDDISDAILIGKAFINMIEEQEENDGLF